jgi:GTP cyclohydrolase I
MMMRGVEKQNSLMSTSSVLGSFHSSAATRSEFMALIGKGRID